MKSFVVIALLSLLSFNALAGGINNVIIKDSQVTIVDNGKKSTYNITDITSIGNSLDTSITYYKLDNGGVIIVRMKYAVIREVSYDYYGDKRISMAVNGSIYKYKKP